MQRRTVLALAGVVLLAVAGCGSSSSKRSATEGSLEALAGQKGQKTVALIPGTGDFAAGPIRYSFLVVDDNGKLVTEPSADVWIAHDYKQRAFQKATARLETVGVPGVSEDTTDVSSIYVVHLRAPKPGTYWVLAKPRDSSIVGLSSLQVRKQSYSPPVGTKAPASKTPTLSTTHGKLAPITTSTHPDRALYQTSVAQALAAHDPFVVSFATPKFCTSRACGPVVDVLSRVRRTTGDKRIRFIHVEVYKNNNPSKGYNRWMREWGLQSEPWTFLVRGDGRIAEKFEGSVSTDELRAAVDSKLRS